jgi:hypothetical protein
MATIWKFPLPILTGDIVEIEMPAGAQILCVQAQKNEGQIWAVVKPEKPKKMRKFKIIGTGNHFPEEEYLDYIGTFQQEHVPGFSFVWHVFEKVDG